MTFFMTDDGGMKNFDLEGSEFNQYYQFLLRAPALGFLCSSGRFLLLARGRCMKAWHQLECLSGAVGKITTSIHRSSVQRRYLKCHSA